MKKIIKPTLLFLLLTFISSLSRCNCDLDFSNNTGSVETSTNDLTNPQNMDLFLDAIEVNIDNTASDYYEIHIMDEEEETLLACADADANPAAPDDGFQKDILYAHLQAQFLASENVEFGDTTPIVVRLVNRTGDSCPDGYVGGDDEEDDSPDLVVSSVNLNYGDLFSGPIEFSSDETVYGTAYFGQEEDTPIEIPVDEDTEGGDLALNQLYFTDEEIADGFGKPEIALFIAPDGTSDMIACLEVEHVDFGNILFAGLEEPFLNSEGNTVTLDDFDSEEDYWMVLTELDQSRCPESDSLSDSTTDILATTGILNVDDFLEQISFEDDYGYFNLFLK